MAATINHHSHGFFASRKLPASLIIAIFTLTTTLLVLSFISRHVVITVAWRTTSASTTSTSTSTSTSTLEHDTQKPSDVAPDPNATATAAAAAAAAAVPQLDLPVWMNKLIIDIGPNTSPILPPVDGDNRTGVLSIEANLGICNHLRETYQKLYVDRFFIVNTAVSGGALSNTLVKFNFYNSDGRSSSLSTAASSDAAWADRDEFDPARKQYGPGKHGFDFVTVLPLHVILAAVRDDVHIELLKIDTQGHDFNVISSANQQQLQRVHSVKAETYLPESNGMFYANVSNDLFHDWIPFMKRMGFELQGDLPTRRSGEYDAIFNRSDLIHG